MFGDLIESLKDERATNIILPLNTILIFSYFFLFVRFGNRFLEIDLPTRLILSVTLSATILFYLMFIEAHIFKREVEGLEFYFNMIFIHLLVFIVIIYVISNYTIPVLIEVNIPNKVMFNAMYIGLITIPLLGEKILSPSSV